MDLHALKGKPFELLLEMERRGRSTMLGRSEEGDSGEWVGVAFRLGNEQYIVSRDEIKEIREHVTPTRVPGAKPWLLGIANIRGQLIPVADLSGFLSGSLTAMQARNARVLIVNHRDIPAGLLVDDVLGFRRFAAGELGELPKDAADRSRKYLKGAYRRDEEVWPVFDFGKLIESNQFLQVAE